MSIQHDGTLQSEDQAMAQGVDALNTAASACRATRLAVDEVRGSLRAAWSGDASGAYDTAVSRWLEQLEIVIQKIDTMGDMLIANGATYSRSEQQNMDEAVAWIGRELDGR